jgi:membrane-associated phospholipid phosphatase
MPSYLFVIVMLYLPDALQPMSQKVMLYILLLIFITTFMIPLFSMLGLRTALTISSLQLEKRRERILPFAFITLFYGLTTYLFHTKIEVNDFLLSIFLGATATVALITAITVFFKISVHAASAGCLIGSMLAMIYRFPINELLWPFSIMIVLAGAILSARLYLNAHNSTQVYSGFGLGFITCFLSIYFLS